MITDQLTIPTATALRDCLVEQARQTTLGPVVNALVLHGAPGTATMDGCDCEGTVEIDGEPVPAQGTAYVRVAQQAPAVLHGAQQQRAGAVRQRRCGVAWVITYEIGLLRCYPLGENGRPLPAEQRAELAIKFASDRVALQRAIDCCDYLDRHSGVELVSILPVGPRGGCAGWSATIRVQQVRG